MRTLFIATLLLATAPVWATPFASGNATQGKATHAQKCAACHTAKAGGNALYTRANRKVKSADHLGQQIAACNSMLALDLFPEDEANLGAYLNGQFYKFK